MYTVFIKDAVFLCDFPDPGLSLKAGSWGFPPAPINLTAGYFHRKKTEITLTERSCSIPFLLICIYPAKVFATALQTTCDLFRAKTGTSSSGNLRS